MSGDPDDPAKVGLVKRLRAIADFDGDSSPDQSAMVREAAEEIERLRAALNDDTPRRP